ncbi:uncharacterized protein LOC120325896 isoform X2 [Styela clava]
MEYTLYRIRWCFVAVVFFAIFTSEFSSCAYGIVNNIVARYFNISPSSVDLLPSATFLVGSIVLVVMALFHNHIRVRAQCIILTIAGLLGSITVTLGFLHNDFYYFVLMGQIFIGISAGISYVIPVNLAANWFSEKEVGTSIAIEFSAIHAGQMLSSLLYHLLLNDVLDSSKGKFDSDKVRNVFAIVLISSSLKKTFPDVPESLTGTIRIAGNMLAVFFSVAAGPLVDRFGRYKLFSALQVTYPAEKVTLMCAHYIPVLVFQSIFIMVERVLMETFNETIAILVPLTASVVSLPMLMAVTSVYHRSNVNNSEKTPLQTKQTNKTCIK